MKNPPNREIVVFNEALDLPAEQRPAYLDRACGGDDALRQRVERLLQMNDNAGNFLRDPAQNVDRPAAPPSRHEAIVQKPGDRIGRYKLLEQIGEGGCGLVFAAEQEEPIRRKVALKIIKLGMDTRQVIARFEAERQALALMDHPNIAKVLDAGATDTGRPYFVMELVDGVKITDYCDQKELPAEARLKLFIEVCHAIQHAHQKGVIHRDIKPSNILVTTNDGAPTPKVIDFGIAKATHGKLSDQTVFTALEQFIGTPAYMSPEQAEVGASDIDTRSDIYSLGVLLYELLTGQTPFDTRKLIQAGLAEIRRTIREQEPPRPSTRLSTMGQEELTTTAKRRQTAPPTLIRLMRGDLDWIVMKALEKDRARRYDTANSLAADVQRHLKSEPVSAQPPSNLYRFGRLVRRNKVVFAAACIVFLALVVGLAVSTWSFYREQQAKLQAQADRRKAESAAAKSQQIAGILTEMLAGAGPEKALGRDTTMLREIMEHTRSQLASELQDQPEVEAELRRLIAITYLQIGDYANSQEEFSKAVHLQEGVFGRDSTNVLKSINEVAEAMIAGAHFSAAEPIVRDQLERTRKIFGDTGPPTAAALQQLAEVRWRLGDLAAADQEMREALAQWRQAQEPKAISIALTDLGLIEIDRGELSKAEADLREAADIRVKLLPPGHPALAMASNNLAMALWYQGNLQEAGRVYEQVVAMCRNLYRDGSPDMAAALNNLSLVRLGAGDLAAAESLQRESLAMVAHALGENDPRTGFARKNLAALLRRRGAIEANATTLREALALDPADSATANALANLFETQRLNPVVVNAGPDSNAWKWSRVQPESNWTSLAYSDASWPLAPVVAGASLFIPRSAKNPIYSHTNLWLRREFSLTAVPNGSLVLQINRNHDAHIFINGIEAAPAIDWTDTGALITSRTNMLQSGRNVLAVQCQDADGAAPIDVRLFASDDPSVGSRNLLEEFGAMITNNTNRADLYLARGAALARTGRWSDAVADFSKAVDLNPADPVAWFNLAPLLVETSNAEAFVTRRHEALIRFAGADDPTVAAHVAILGSLEPSPAEEVSAAAKLADAAAAADYADAYLAFRQLAKGLAEYRQGHFTNAVASLNKSTATAQNQTLPGWSHERERNTEATAFLVVAMAQAQLHDSVAARTVLSQADAIIDTQFPSLESGDIGGDWPDWLIARILQREAHFTIQ